MIEAVIVGAGPYGLSLAAHFRRRGLPFRIFGPPMENWLRHMPKDMLLKSDGFASNLYDPDEELTLEKFCAEQHIEYDHSRIPVRLDTFTAYGLAFKDRFVPDLEDRTVVSIEKHPDGYRLELSNGELVHARQVILAVGITHFTFLPESLVNLPRESVSHSYQHRDVDNFRGRSVVVIGGGASAIELAATLHEIGTDVTLAARAGTLLFHQRASAKPRSMWQQIRYPQSGLGPGLRSRFYADAPGLFHYLPEKLRIQVVQTHLGPSGHWSSRERVERKVPKLLGYEAEVARVQNGKVALQLRRTDGAVRHLLTDHVIAATGYHVDLRRLPFLSRELRAQIELTGSAPKLSRSFESTSPGLYFVGLASANSFGPVARFAFGAAFTARKLTQSVAASAAKGRSFSAITQGMPMGAARRP